MKIKLLSLFLTFAMCANDQNVIISQDSNSTDVTTIDVINETKMNQNYMSC